MMVSQKILTVLLSLLLAASLPVGCAWRSAFTATPTPEPWQSIAQAIEAEDLLDHVRFLADDALRGRGVGSPEEDTARDYIAERFAKAGLEPFTAAGLTDYIHPFPIAAEKTFLRDPTVQTLQADNVVGLIKGTTYPNRHVMMGAHYDHLGEDDNGIYNGADDDASGVAAVLETARVFHELGLKPQETVIFVCFSGEEVGTLGSQALVKLLKEEGLDDSLILLNVEVIGATRGEYLDVWDEDLEENEPLVEAVTEAGRLLGIKVVRQDRDPGSDATRFNQEGLAAISISWAWSLENHPYYHSVDDDVQYIDPQAIESATEVGAMALWLLANDGR